MAQFKIETDVAIPVLTREGVTKYPWAGMAHKQSFFVPIPDGVKPLNIAASGSSWCKRHREGFYVIQRIVDGGVRVWMKSMEEDLKEVAAAEKAARAEKKGK